MMREYLRSSAADDALLRLGAGILDDFTPLHDFGLEEGRELFRGVTRRFGALREQLFFHFRRLQRPGDRVVQFRDDVPGRAVRREYAVPSVRAVTRHGLGDSWDVGHHARSF